MPTMTSGELITLLGLVDQANDYGVPWRNALTTIILSDSKNQVNAAANWLLDELAKERSKLLEKHLVAAYQQVCFACGQAVRGK